MITPTTSQLAIRNAEELGLLVLAPAGCGKTEALALRVAGLIEQGHVVAPRKVLVATFTNRARDNIRERLRAHVRPGDLRDQVSVQNFHGLAGRIYRAHANVIGLDPTTPMPDRDWVGDWCRALPLSFDERRETERIIQRSKQEVRDDAAVLTALADYPAALDLERRRVREGLLTYDDLLRHAELILANDVVADLYRNHFACLVVDEFQDLTPQQLRVIQRIGYGRTTYAGDEAQGIYGFTGADPEAVTASITAEVQRTVMLTESHRSSPAVLALVNAVNRQTGGSELTCAQPASWPDGGVAARLSFATAGVEAVSTFALMRYILTQAPAQRVAVVARTTNRRRFIDEIAASVIDIDCYQWDDPTLDSQTAQLLKRALQRTTSSGFVAAGDRTTYLWQLADGDNVLEPDIRRYLRDALGWVIDLLNEGMTPAAVAARIRVGTSDTLLTKPGIHLLNAHTGKGQQFDWVFAIGLEEGCLPFLQAKSPAEIAEEARVLGVMLSRARHGVIVSRADDVPTLAGKPWSREPSRFWRYFNGAAACRNHEGLIRQLKNLDWTAIADR